MKEIQYHTLSFSSGPDTGPAPGIYPQIVVSGDTYRNDPDPFFKKIDDRSFPAKEDINLNVFDIVFYAKITDILSCSVIGHETGLFMTEKVKSVIEKFNPNLCKFYPIKIDGSEKGKGMLDYYFMHVVEDVNIINYPKSEFIDVIPDDEPLIKVESFEEMLEKNKTRKFGIRPKNYFLNYTPELFRHKHDTEIFISEKLRNALEAAKLTGVKIESYTHKDFFIE